MSYFLISFVWLQKFWCFPFLQFIDFRMGEESGYIRFDDPDTAIKARAAAVLTDEGGFIVKTHIATLEPLSGKAIYKPLFIYSPFSTFCLFIVFSWRTFILIASHICDLFYVFIRMTLR